MAFNISDLYSALRNYRDEVGYDLLSPRGQGIFDKHYGAANKEVAIAEHPETGKPYIRWGSSSIPYENKHRIDVEHTDWSPIGMHPSTLEITHKMPQMVLKSNSSKEPAHYGLEHYGSWDMDTIMHTPMQRLAHGIWNSTANFHYPDPSNQPHDPEVEEIFGDYAHYGNLHQGGIHDIIKEMMRKPAIGGVVTPDDHEKWLSRRAGAAGYKQMTPEHMKQYFAADNEMQKYTPSHLINVRDMTGDSQHVLNLDTEELHEGVAKPKKGWLM